MYNVSPTYRTKIAETTRSTRLRGQIVLGAVIIPLTGEDILPGSIDLKNQCVDKDDFNLGSVYSATLKLSIFDRVTALDLKGATITLEFGLVLSPTVTEYVPLGVFNIIDAYHKLSTIIITAMDNMILLDKPFETALFGTPDEILTNLTLATGIAVENTTVAAFPNGSDTLSATPGESLQTWRDLLMWLSQYLGTFATINRQGKVWIRDIVSDPVRSITPEVRFKSPTVKDEIVTITALKVTFSSTLYDFNIVADPDSGKTYTMDDNPLFWDYEDSQSGYRLENILNGLGGLSHRSGEVVFNGDPSLDVGDYVTLSDTAMGDVVFRITSMNWKSKGKSTIRSAGVSGLLKAKEDLSYRKNVNRAQVQIDKLSGQIDLLGEEISIVAKKADDVQGAQTEIVTRIDGVTITVTAQVDKISELQTGLDQNSSDINDNANAIALQKTHYDYGPNGQVIGTSEGPGQMRFEFDVDSKPQVVITDGFNDTTTIKSGSMTTKNVVVEESFVVGNHKVQKVTGSVTETIFYPI